MMSLEALLSYTFFISILITLSAHQPQEILAPPLEQYRLLGDISIILQKSGVLEEFARDEKSVSISASFAQITFLTGYCVSLRSDNASASNCACPTAEKFTETLFTAGIPPKKLGLSIQKERYTS